jgi:hypothetical protein
MRCSERLLTAALTATLLLAGAAAAQSPDQKQELPQERVRPAPLGVADVVERIMAFDKNKDGKISRDELPERMQFLIELGDTNKDGALDRDEIKKLAARLASGAGEFGIGGGVRFGPGSGPRPGAPGGFGVAGQVRFGGPDAAEGVVEDLKLPANKREQALAAVKAHQEKVRKLMDQAHAELLQTMKEILSEEEFKDFKAALDRPRGGATVINVTPRDVPRGGVEKKPEPPQK